jgi:hypothetical protein
VRWAAALAAVACVLTSPSPAAAHIRARTVAVDLRADVRPLPAGAAAAFALRVYESDLGLRLTVRPGHTVSVRGYEGEAFLRVDRSGVSVNAASPTAVATGLARAGRGWQALRGGRSVSWHDARVRALPSTARSRGWTIPLVVDGAALRLEGTVRRVAAPPVWPWIALGLVLLAVLGGSIARTRLVPSRATVALGCLSAVATLAIAAAFALDGEASRARWVEAVDEVVLAVAGVGVVLRGRPAVKPLACAALGLVALAAALDKLPVFLHGVVLAAPSPTVTRLFVLMAVPVGLSAAASGLFAFLARPE